MRLSSFKTTLYNIKNVVFNKYHLNILKETSLLDIWELYSNILQEKFVKYLGNSFGYIDDTLLGIIEFIGIRVIYMALSLDEFCTNNHYYLKHSDINKYVLGGWYDKQMNWIEREMMDYCNWNPIRFCKQNINDSLLEKESSLFSEIN